MWILTRKINQYNQNGDDLVTAWLVKPDRDTIQEILNCSEEYAKHILNGGGRIDVEDEWYHFTELKSGELYTHH